MHEKLAKMGEANPEKKTIKGYKIFETGAKDLNITIRATMEWYISKV